MKFVFLAVLLLFTYGAFANMGEPPTPNAGNITGDSYLKHLKVLREELTINLSEIHKGKPVKVWAKYIIESPELFKNVELVFVANGLTESRYKVELDGRLINGYLSQFSSIPENWLPPDSIYFRQAKIPYLYRHEGLISFRFDSLTPGEHTLIVDYDADASEWYDEDGISITRTFVYILKPTDNWKAFENFHVTVFHPGGWECSSNLDLKRATYSAVSGDWSKLPASYLSIAIRKPPNQATIKAGAFVILSWLSYAALMIFLMSRVIRYRIRNGKKSTIQVINCILVAFTSSIFFFFIYYWYFELLDHWLDGHLNPIKTYGIGYHVFAFPVVWLAALIIALVVDYLLTTRIRNRIDTNYLVSSQ